mgnify:CR=1 FL=1
MQHIDTSAGIQDYVMEIDSQSSYLVIQLKIMINNKLDGIDSGYMLVDNFEY